MSTFIWMTTIRSFAQDRFESNLVGMVEEVGWRSLRGIELNQREGIKTMQVLTDGCAFERSYQRGIQRYFRELFSRVPEDVGIELYLNRWPVTEIPGVARVTERTEEYLRNRGDLVGRATSKLRRKYFPTPYPKGDVFHSSYFTRSPDPTIPEVLTIHDMVAEVLPYWYDGDAASEISIKRECILGAERIIAISQATADDLVAIYPEIAGRITVIYSGAEHLEKAEETEIASRMVSRGDYVVFVGDRRGYKNFASLLESMKSAEWPPGMGLRVIGADFSEAERIAIRYRGLENLVTVDVRPTDAAMREVLVGSRGFVFPSLMEGFGFPLVEAQGLGVPVVASDTRVFREIGGEGFVRVKPMDPDSIARGVAKVLERSERERLIGLGLKNIERFSWNECARRTVDVWKQVAREVGH